MKFKYLALLVSAGLIFAGCNNKDNNNQDVNQKNQVSTSEEGLGEKSENSKKLVYTSFYPIYDMTKQIGGDKIEVENLGSLETEAHDWEASAKDLANLNEADLLIINGAGMESWKDSVSGSSDVEILDTSKDLDLIKTDEEDDHDHDDHEDDHDDHEDADHKDHEDADHDDHDHHHHGEFDPHTWLSPSMGKDQAKVIYEKLAELDPENKDYYKANYDKLAGELDQIIKEYKEKFASKEDNEFVVPHEAFGYLCREFDLEQIPLTGITSTEEPDAKTMQEVTDKVKEEDIDTIFYEKGGSSKAAQAIAIEIDGKAVELSTLEFVSKEDLENEVHYQDLIGENLESIYQSLKK